MTPAQTRFLACIRDMPFSWLNSIRADEAAKVRHDAIDREIERRG